MQLVENDWMVKRVAFTERSKSTCSLGKFPTLVKYCPIGQKKNDKNKETNKLLMTFIVYREHAKSKRCLKNLIYTECSLSPETLELTELAFADHNPFCADNRDPGATGNDQCYGVKDISGPAGIDAFLSTDKPITTNAAAGIKTSVFQAFLSVFPTIWFFFSF